MSASLHKHSLQPNNPLLLKSCKGKEGKTVPVTKEYKGSKCVAPLILDTKWRSVVNFTFRPL